MLHLLGRGQAPKWDEEKHDIDEVFGSSVLPWSKLCLSGCL